MKKKKAASKSTSRPANKSKVKPKTKVQRQNPKQASGTSRAQRAPGDAFERAETDPPLIGVIAPAAPIPLIELEISAERIAKSGFSVGFHPQIQNVNGVFAGSDTERALAFLDYAYDPEMDILWGARGGYGSVRILPILDEIVQQVGVPPKKTLVGYSDLTVLLDYAAARWGWRVIHGPMPATEQFAKVKGKDFDSYMKAVGGDDLPEMAIKPLFKRNGLTEIEGVLAGGNLTTIASLIGTPYQMNLDGKILFLEDVGEYVYRIDRTLQQLLLSKSLQGVRAIVLGTFTQCEDACPKVLKDRPKSEAAREKSARRPLRPLIPENERLEYLFKSVSEVLGIPIYQGLNVGHGDGTGALELQVPVRLNGKKLMYL